LEDLLNRLEKSAGFLNYLKNVSGHTVRALEKEQKVTGMNSDRWTQLPKEIHNAKVDRRVARLGTGAVGMAAGAGLGGYKAYDQSKQQPMDTDLYEQNQVTQNNLQTKVAKELNHEMGEDSLLERLNKTANAMEDPEEEELQQQQLQQQMQQQVPQQQVPLEAQQPLAEQEPDPRLVELQQILAQQQATPPQVQGEPEQQVPQDDPHAELQQLLAQQQAAPPQAQGAPQQVPQEAMQQQISQDPHAELEQLLAQQQATPPQAEETPAVQGYGALENNYGAEENSRQGAGSVSNAPAGVDKTASNQLKGVNDVKDLLVRLEKTAEEVEDHPRRQDRKFLTEALIGAGPLGYFAKKNNKMGVSPDDSHAMANAKLEAEWQALRNGLMGAAANPESKAMGAATGAVQGAIGGGIAGGINGWFHDQWDKAHPVPETEMEQEASAVDLLARLEKTAEEDHPRRQDRKFLTEALIGAGPLGYFAKKNNKMGVNADDSHAMANAKLEAEWQALKRGMMGAAANPESKAMGAAQGALQGAVGGGIAGGVNGWFHDRWDKSHPQYAKPTEKEASADDLLARLEKTAGVPSLIKPVANKAQELAISGAGKAGQAYRSAKNNNMLNNKYVKGAGLVGVGAVAGAGATSAHDKNVKEALDKSAAEAVPSEEKSIVAKSQKELLDFMHQVEAKDHVKPEEKPENQTKCASEEEDMINGLFKEAAAAIMDMHFPEIRQHVDPMHRISF
jgi:hypothetical protein